MRNLEENRVSTRANQRGLRFRKRVDGVYDLIKGADLLVNGGTLEQVAACISQFKTNGYNLDSKRVRKLCSRNGYKMHRRGEDSYDLIKDGETVLSAATEEQIRAYLEPQLKEVSRSTQTQLPLFEQKSNNAEVQMRRRAAYRLGLTVQKLVRQDSYSVRKSGAVLAANLTIKDLDVWLAGYRAALT